MKNILKIFLSFFFTISVASAQYDYNYENYDFEVSSYDDSDIVVNDVLVDGQNVGGCGNDVVDGIYFEYEENPVPPSFVPPAEVPFGALARMKALSSVTGYNMQVSVGGNVLATDKGYFGPIKSGMPDIEKGLAKAKLSYIIEDARREIMHETLLVNSSGEEVLYSQNNFKLRKKQLPEGSRHLHFWFRNGLWIDVPGVEGATVENTNGIGASLVVENGRIFLPGWVLNNYTEWDTLQIHFVGGIIQKYDHTGRNITSAFAQTQITSVGVDNFERTTVQKGYYRSENFGQWWNPIIELTNPVKGWVVLDVNQANETWNRPTTVYIATPEDLQKGLGWKVIYDYDPKTDDVVTERISIPLENKMYYIYFEWDNSWGKG